MGVLEFFGTLIKNDITSTSIRTNYTDKTIINHLLIDFNSIIHVCSQKIIVDVNVFLQMVLKSLYQNRTINSEVFNEKFTKYNMQNIQKKINQKTKPQDVIQMFQEYFNEAYMDKLIITLVINTVLHIIRTYCHNKTILTLMLAIDGVPSKGKMVEQKQRRYMGAVTEDYKKKILAKYKDYLEGQEDYVYLATKKAIRWSRNKITPGTAFMDKMANYLTSEKIQAKLKINRPNMDIIISDVHEIGEGEKKIVNYVNKYLPNTDESIMIYSPDADVILLCILLPVKKLYMLRHNLQTSIEANKNIYDLIDIRFLKSNISYYINNHPNYAKENFDIDKINYDLVCISTLFGNDFVPKMETINVKQGFQIIMDAYLKTLLKLKDKGYYLVNNDKSEYKLNFIFLKSILRYLLPYEYDFIKHNNLYGQYITIGQIKYVFDYMEINSENLVSTFNYFRNEYENLKRGIKQNGNLSQYESNPQFMTSLKKALIVVMDNQPVNTSYLTNKELIKLLRDYYKKYRDFPRLNINLNTWSHSIDDQRHRRKVKEKKLNDYQKEVYRFENMLDEYYVKFNAQTLDLSKNKISDFYQTYFDVELIGENGKLTKEANQVMQDYVEGMLWVFNYYFNDISYINWWYYQHERAPLMQDVLKYLDRINLDHFNEIFTNLDSYQVTDIKSYFNPIEQLMYVSPMIPDIIHLLPKNYQVYIKSDNIDPFLKMYFLDIDEITNRLWKEKVSSEVDCHSIIYFNKCLIRSISRPTTTDDKLFLQAIRKVKQTDNSKKRAKSKEPSF